MNDRSILPLIKGAPVLEPEDSVRRAAGLIRASDGATLIVTGGGRVIGTVNEQAIASHLAMSDGSDEGLDRPLAPLVNPGPVCISSGANLQQAAHVFGSTDADALPVIDNSGALRGIIYRRDVIGLMTRNLRPPSIAGMATPLGVYLTTGSHTGGAGNLGLFLTGMSLAGMMIAASLIADGLMRLVGLLTGLPIQAYLMSAPIGRFNLYDLPIYIYVGLTIVVMLVILRLSPLSGYHAAEHMTVHAIEAGEAVTTDVVRHMPRVHPRCGTNLMAAAGVFLILVSKFSGGVAVIIALLVVVIGWRAVGGWLQSIVTTKTPSDRQLANGVAAGKQLLERFQEQPNFQLTGFDRIWRMGLLQTASGLATGYWLLTWLLHVARVPFPLT